LAKPRWAKRSLAALFGLAATAVFGTLLVLGWSSAQLGHQLEIEASTTSATIVAKDERSVWAGAKGGQPEYRPDYFMTYRFTAGDGTTHFNEVGVSPTFFFRTAVGDSTPVRYLAENPKRSEVEFGHTGASSFRVLVFGGFGTLIGLGVVAAAVFRPRLLKI
jgi:hypothetical protein